MAPLQRRLDSTIDDGHHRLDHCDVDLEPVTVDGGPQTPDPERLDERHRRQRPARHIRPLGAHEHGQRRFVEVGAVVAAVVAVVAAEVLPGRPSAMAVGVDLRVHRQDAHGTAAAAVRAQKPAHLPDDVGPTDRRPTVQRVHRVVPRPLAEHVDHRFGGRVQPAVVVGGERFSRFLRGHVARRQGEHIITLSAYWYRYDIINIMIAMPDGVSNDTRWLRWRRRLRLDDICWILYRVDFRKVAVRRRKL